MMSMKLFYSPGACSMASHVTLLETEMPFERIEISTKTGANYSDEYKAINPASRVPALQIESGEVVTENLAIMTYLADLVPDKELLPPLGSLARTRANEIMAFLASTVHPTFRQCFRPERYVVDPAIADQPRQRGLDSLNEALTLVEARLTERSTTFAVANHMTIADIYLLVFWIWSRRPPVARGVPKDMPAWHDLAKSLGERASVRRMLDIEQQPLGVS